MIDIRVEIIHRCCLVNALHKNPGGRVYYLIQCKKCVRILLMLICYLTAFSSENFNLFCIYLKINFLGLKVKVEIYQSIRESICLNPGHLLLKNLFLAIFELLKSAHLFLS